MHTTDWNPDLYLKFGNERTQPSIDLVARINCDNPQRIIDIGCGPGNSTQVLAQRWPGARITGIDNSPAMIEKAKAGYPNMEWKIADAGTDDIEGIYDLVFSNATIQWIPDHEALLERFSRLLPDNGILAVQVPQFFDMPLGKSIAAIAADNRWRTETEEVTAHFTIHDGPAYYDYLTALFRQVEMWQTDYVHIFDSHLSVLEMIRSTGLRPYLNKLTKEEDRRDFEERVLQSVVKDYPLQKNGKVLFPFKRLFFIAGK